MYIRRQMVSNELLKDPHDANWHEFAVNVLTNKQY